ACRWQLSAASRPRRAYPDGGICGSGFGGSSGSSGGSGTSAGSGSGSRGGDGSGTPGAGRGSGDGSGVVGASGGWAGPGSGCSGVTGCGISAVAMQGPYPSGRDLGVPDGDADGGDEDSAQRHLDQGDVERDVLEALAHP